MAETFPTDRFLRYGPCMSEAKRSENPVPYTAPDYDPDQSGRPPASVPTRTDTTAPTAERAKEPQPYVAPEHDPARS